MTDEGSKEKAFNWGNRNEHLLKRKRADDTAKLTVIVQPIFKISDVCVYMWNIDIFIGN